MNDEVLYETTFGMIYDWFCMLAAHMYTLLVVTNHEMRDHYFHMLAQRSFPWNERQQVHFVFGAGKMVLTEMLTIFFDNETLLLLYPWRSVEMITGFWTDLTMQARTNRINGASAQTHRQMILKRRTRRSIPPERY
jgi:hypothetical protein